MNERDQWCNFCWKITGTKESDCVVCGLSKTTPDTLTGAVTQLKYEFKSLGRTILNTLRGGNHENEKEKQNQRATKSR